MYVCVYIYIHQLNQLKETSNIFQEECLKLLDNQRGNQPKVKRKGVNSNGDIVTNDKTFKKILKEFDEKTNKRKM